MASKVKERNWNKKKKKIEIKQKKCENGRDKYENKILKKYYNISSHMFFLKFTF